MPPSIWPTTDSGLSALPTSCAVAICTTFTRPSSGSTSTTARWATKANAVWQSPCPFSSRCSVGRWWYSNGLLERRPAVASATVTRRRRIELSTTVVVRRSPAAADRRRSRGDVLEQPLADARHAASTAPPLIQVWRDADVDPAEPIDVSTARARRRRRRGPTRAICSAIVTKPWPTSTVANFSVATPSASGTAPSSSRRSPREYIRFLIDDAPADAAPDVRSDRPSARRRRAGASGRRAADRLRRAAAARAVSRMQRATGATLSTTWPVMSRSPVLHRVAQPDLDGARARTPRRACPSGSRARSTPAPRRTRASLRRAGCSCARPIRRRSRSRSGTGPACA